MNIIASIFCEQKKGNEKEMRKEKKLKMKLSFIII